jgi:SNF2 family DNA or RNA helicase
VIAIQVTFDEIRSSGSLICQPNQEDSAIWMRIKGRALSAGELIHATHNTLELPWISVLDILREYGTRSFQETHSFRFEPIGRAQNLIQKFAHEFRAAESHRLSEFRTAASANTVEDSLQALKFTKRKLRTFQVRDVANLVSLPHGANFSVPGAGKTTVTLALHLLTQRENSHILVVGPKACFPAWREVISECMDESVANERNELFQVLTGNETDIDRLLRNGCRRHIISYDLLIRNEQIFYQYLMSRPVHLVLDEAHRIKAGESSQRGALLLKLSCWAFRRDILTGTPMPQGADDLASQLAFLWPGSPYRLQIQRGAPPRSVLGNLYVRTTKRELGLEPAKRQFHYVDMAPGQLALYSIVRNETLRQLSRTVKTAGENVDFISAKRSVMRLLQLSSNPTLAIRGMTNDMSSTPPSGIIEQVLLEGASRKIQAVAQHARELAKCNLKCVIWTIFTENIRELERCLVDLKPLSLYGEIPSGEQNDINTREGRIFRFHTDPSCFVLIANPAAAGEGISLHKVCHNAIYLDRSYVSTHYLQSIDRIHRLGLDPGVDTFIHIYECRAPIGIGSIDLSVRRRLASKIRGMEQLLDDPDLRQIALDEENASDPVDFDIDLQDLVDLVAELEGNTIPPADEI